MFADSLVRAVEDWCVQAHSNVSGDTPLCKLYSPACSRGGVAWLSLELNLTLMSWISSVMWENLPIICWGGLSFIFDRFMRLDYAVLFYLYLYTYTLHIHIYI